MHYGPPFQSVDTHRTGSVSETLGDRTALGETEAKQEEEVEGKCFRVSWRRLRHLSFSQVDLLSSSLSETLLCTHAHLDWPFP